jgi:flagellar basal-body rod protein FlgF
MADAIYVSMSGAVARAAQLESVADNLANAQTPGFRAERPAFQTFLPRARGDKAYVAAVQSALDLRAGPVVTTGRPLDVVPGNGTFLAVRAPSGQTSYTRNGRLEVTAGGELRAAGLPVLDPKGKPLTVPPGATPEVAPDGTVSVGGTAVGRLARYQLDGALQRLGPSLLVPGGGGSATPSAAPLRFGELEMGNSSTLEAAVQLVTAQRHFETSMQALETYRKLGDRSTEVGRVR